MGDDQRQGVTEAGHAVLDRLEEVRSHMTTVDVESLFRMAAKSADPARMADLESRRVHAITAAAFLILAAEKIDGQLK